ncbi:hypothetical protein [Bacillus sp. KH172YL63]|uniref:hypothetical protein n=1 Tax=Bacillus sp. KH172YL63 TaxID=2709784 RepID=UPI0013E4B705|nr:hypothetical protein [Bacillus sp. KH172YL63]BCB04297.1 hypothetical protein KH172YL63_24300 [Bacillus sp. KH172YL63]
MTWLIVSASLFILLIVAEEMIYYYLRSRIIKNPPKTERRKWKLPSLFSKGKNGQDSPSL